MPTGLNSFYLIIVNNILKKYSVLLGLQVCCNWNYLSNIFLPGGKHSVYLNSFKFVLVWKNVFSVCEIIMSHQFQCKDPTLSLFPYDSSCTWKRTHNIYNSLRRMPLPYRLVHPSINLIKLFVFNPSNQFNFVESIHISM